MSLVANVIIDDELAVNALSEAMATFHPLAQTQVMLPDESAITSIKMPICPDTMVAAADTSLLIEHMASCLVPFRFQDDALSRRKLAFAVMEGFFLEVAFMVPQGVFGTSLEDEFEIIDWNEDEDTEAETEVWDCWVLNGQEFFPSVYSGFDFNSYAVMDGKAYGASKGGIYSIGAGHEEDFQAGIILPPTSLGMTQNKRFRVGYVGFSGGQPAVKVQVDDGEDRVFQVVRNRFPLQRDLVGRKWQFALADFDTLEFVELFPIILHRSRKA